MAVTITYTEKAGSPKEYLTSKEVVVERRLMCVWEDRLVLARELLGFWWGGIYYLPDMYLPQGNEKLYYVYADDVNIEPVISGPKVTGMGYEKALLTVTYRLQDFYQVDDDNVLITEHIEPASEFITLDREGLGFGTGADRKELKEENMEAPSKINRMIDWVYTLHQQAWLFAYHFDLAGKVNNAVVRSRSLGVTFPAETLLCGNPSASREITRAGNYSWTITYRFTYKNEGTIAVPLGWNHFPRTDNADSGGINFERLTDSNDANVPIYTLANFSTVVR